MQLFQKEFLELWRWIKNFTFRFISLLQEITNNKIIIILLECVKYVFLNFFIFFRTNSSLFGSVIWRCNRILYSIGDHWIKWRRPPMEDNLKTLKIEYLSNHWLNKSPILNLSLGDKTKIKNCLYEDDLQWSKNC